MFGTHYLTLLFHRPLLPAANWSWSLPTFYWIEFDVLTVSRLCNLGACVRAGPWCPDQHVVLLFFCIHFVVIFSFSSVCLFCFFVLSNKFDLIWFRNLNFVFSVLICRSSVFCILALGSGQRLLCRLGSGLGLVLVLVLRFCAYSYGGVYS